MTEPDEMVVAVEEWLAENPAPYRCKHSCERDQLKDRIAALIAAGNKLATYAGHDASYGGCIGRSGEHCTCGYEAAEQAWREARDA